MPLMANRKKKPTTDPSQTAAPSNRRGAALHVWLEPVLMVALERYLESLEFPTTKTAIAEAAIQNLLKEKGYWPPPKDGAEK